MIHHARCQANAFRNLTCSKRYEGDNLLSIHIPIIGTQQRIFRIRSFILEFIVSFYRSMNTFPMDLTIFHTEGTCAHRYGLPTLKIEDSARVSFADILAKDFLLDWEVCCSYYWSLSIANLNAAARTFSLVGRSALQMGQTFQDFGTTHGPIVHPWRLDPSIG